MEVGRGREIQTTVVNGEDGGKGGGTENTTARASPVWRESERGRGGKQHRTGRHTGRQAVPLGRNHVTQEAAAGISSWFFLGRREGTGTGACGVVEELFFFCDTSWRL